MYADHAVQFAETEQGLQRMVNEFNRVLVCDKRKLKVNPGKSKMMVFERREYDKIDFEKLYCVKKESEFN